MRDPDDEPPLYRRRAGRAARRRTMLLGGIAVAAVGPLGCGGGLLAYALWPRKQVVVVVGNGGAVVAVGPQGESPSRDELTEMEWRDLLDHPW